MKEDLLKEWNIKRPVKDLDLSRSYVCTTVEAPEAALLLFLFYTIGVVMITIGLTLSVKEQNAPEYELELFNEKVVKLKSNLNDKIYYISPEEIPEYLDLDNL